MEFGIALGKRRWVGDDPFAAREIIGKLGETHWATLAVAAGTFAIMAIVPRLVPWLPSALVGMALAGAAVPLLGLAAAGVKTVGAVPAGLPALKLPYADPALLSSLFAEAAGLALVTFSSMMLTGRSFAAKNGYDVDADQDFAALGAANVASALSQGFAVSGADSRTAVSDAAGGRTQAVGLVAAAAVALVLLFFTAPLQFVPLAALGRGRPVADRYREPPPHLSHRSDRSVALGPCHARRRCRGAGQCHSVRRDARSVAVHQADVAASC